MITLSLIALISVVAVATVLSLLDSMLRGYTDFKSLMRDKAMLDAGYVPQVDAQETRLRARPSRAVVTIRPDTRRASLPISRQAL